MHPILYILLILTPAVTVVRGWLFALTWGWFVVPVFEGAPDLALIDAIGVSFIVGLLTTNYGQKQSTDESAGEIAARLTLASVLFYGMALIIAVIIHAFQ